MVLPAEIYQPISELQKRSEEVEYSELLDKVGMRMRQLAALLAEVTIKCSILGA